MRFKLFLIRKTKALFTKWNLHLLVEPFTGFFLNLVYLSRFSKWRKIHNRLPYNDFYSPQWNYSARYSLYEHILKKEKLDGPIYYLEFGVSKGHSFKWWLEKNTNPDSSFCGFDTFTGLPENWNLFKAGDMSTDGKIPEVNDSRATFVKGLFQQTLPNFLKTFSNHRRNVIHLDADLYTSTLFVLASLAPFLKQDDIILFDEFAVPRHEFLAFENFVSSFRINYEVIGAANNYYFVAVKIKK